MKYDESTGDYILTELDITDYVEFSTIPYINQSYEIYPNPFCDQIHIKIDEVMFQDLQIELFDISGKRMLIEDDISRHHTIDVSGLEKGIYVVKLKNNKGIFLDTEKIIK